MVQGRRSLVAALALAALIAQPAAAQLIPPTVADGPSTNSMDMLYGRAGRVLENITTRIESVDLTARTLTIPGGTVLVFANTINAAGLRAGQSVSLQYEEEGGKKILHSITPIGN